MQCTIRRNKIIFVLDSRKKKKKQRSTHRKLAMSTIVNRTSVCVKVPALYYVGIVRIVLAAAKRVRVKSLHTVLCRI